MYLDTGGCTPLHLAVRHNRAECVDLLLKTGVNVVAGVRLGERFLKISNDNHNETNRRGRHHQQIGN